ncbi:hypothetical protein [Aeromonas sobria]|uniref:hypothetical protein n=1 Tax=Aeromonas sobria TaxID=646 RepID=UPI0011DF7630|nr:hypothetical protein [Aeromonas sobria]
MARKDASLELRKARNGTGQLELNQSEVVRLVGILNGTTLPPRLSASPGLVLASVLAGAPNRSSAMLGGSVVLDAVLTSHTHSRGQLVGEFVIECTMASTSRAPVPVIAGEYDQNVFRGPANAMGDVWDRADSHSQHLSSEWQKAGTERATSRSLWQQAAAHQQQVAELGEQMPQTFMANQQCFAEGLPVSQQNRQGYDSLAAGHVANQSLWVEAAPVSSWRLVGFTNPPRFDLVWQADQWQEGIPIGKGVAAQAWHHGKPLIEGWRDGWDEAMWPTWGKTPPPEPPKPPIRPDKRTLRLEFGRKRAEAELEFVWYPDNTVVIPTRRVYFVINAASVVRARDGKEIPVSSVDLSLDEGAWAWSFNANVIRHEDAKAIYNEEIDITVNGHHWRFKVDSWRRNRSFNQHDCQVSGRGLSAYLSSTYLIPNSYTEPAARNMQQLAVEELPQGWSLTWGAADWLVPGGTFSYEKKAPIDVLQTLAEAAGATLLPGQSSKTIQVIPRYKVLPWKLPETAPDIVIPSAIMVTMGEQYHDGQNVNGVWVSSDGNTLGACLVKRQGSGADRLLPDVMNPLMVDVVGIRALGTASLAEVGPRYDEDIELPLSQDTGLILPGSIVQTDEGKGYSRGIKISVKRGQNMALTVRQSITIERPEV